MNKQQSLPTTYGNTQFNKRLFEITSTTSFLSLVLFSYSGFNVQSELGALNSISTERSQLLALATIVTSLLAITLVLKPINRIFIRTTVLMVVAAAVISFPLRNPLVFSEGSIFGIPLPDWRSAIQEPQILSNTIVIQSLLLPLALTTFTSTATRRYLASIFVLFFLLFSIVYKVKFEALSAVGVSVSFGFGLYLFWLAKFLILPPSTKESSDLKIGIVLTTLVHLPIFAFLSQAQSGASIWMIYFIAIFGLLILAFSKSRNEIEDRNEY